mgnify:CR=1 FL=1
MSKAFSLDALRTQALSQMQYKERNLARPGHRGEDAKGIAMNEAKSCWRFVAIAVALILLICQGQFNRWSVSKNLDNEIIALRAELVANGVLIKQLQEARIITALSEIKRSQK